MKDISPVDKVLSPSGRYITFLGRSHILYILKKEMPLPPGCRLVLQQGHNANRWAVYKK